MSMDEPLCVHCVQVAQLGMGLQQQGALQHFNGVVGFPSFVCHCVALSVTCGCTGSGNCIVALCCKLELLSGIPYTGSKQAVPDAL